MANIDIENKCFDGIDINQLFDTGKSLSAFSSNFDTWKGETATSFKNSINTNVQSIETVQNAITQFNQVLDIVEKYTQNQEMIEVLETFIANERANPSKVISSSYTVNGVVHTEYKRVVDEAKIAAWQSRINQLEQENIALKEKANSLCASIGNMKVGSTGGNLLPKTNINIAHRGYHYGGIWENTAEAFKAAGEAGFYGCETDVRFDANGNLVCAHNFSGNGGIHEKTPTFKEYLQICKDYGMTAIIDLKYKNGTGKDKTGLSPAIIKEIQEMGMMDSCVIQTNNYSDIPTIRQTSSDARIWLLTEASIGNKELELIQNNQVEAVNLHSGVNASPGTIKKLNEMGVETCVWGVFTQEGKNTHIRGGANYIMSDNLLDTTPYVENSQENNEQEKKN